MKKICLFIFTCLLLVGCSQPSKEDKQFEKYNSIKEKLVNQKEFSDSYPFNVSLVYNTLDDVYRYDIIINQTSEPMYSIEAMAYASEDDTSMCPTIGLFDEMVYHLKPNYIDKPNGYYKGVQLSGKTTKKQKVKLYIKYYTDEKKTKSVEKYIEVRDEIR